MTDLLDTSGSPPTAPLGRQVPPLLETHAMWTDEMVAMAGIPVHDMPFVSVGGGMGSFIMADYLRVAGGVPTSGLRVLSNLDAPWQTYEYLTRVSQLPRAKRIRSDSSSRPDNLWGFPSYAWSEAMRGPTLKPLLQVLLEPVFADFYTPVLDNVLRGLEREAHRIRYWDMLVRGEVRLVRRRIGGGYFVLLWPYRREGEEAGGPDEHIAFRARDVHLAVGYPGLRFLPDMQLFRERFNDFHHVVNGYEDHEHVYHALRTRPGTVLVRGGGVVTSAVLHRLITERLRLGTQTRIVHLFRSYYDGNHGPHPWARRRGRDGFAYQGFNYPKSTWGGQVKARMRRLEGGDRARLYDQIGGTTTPYRRHWQRALREARRGGWYRALNATIAELRLDGTGVVATTQAPEGELDIKADYVIDCTGLVGDISEHRVLDDLLRNGGAGRNPLGRLDVGRDFAVRGADSPPGRLYATGAAAYGGYFPGVDTFLGLQIAAQEVTDDVAARGFGTRMSPGRSIAQWLKWVTGRQI
ncbi:hypothetical protein SMC26_12235 [Actinomadura fulvescens]